MFLSDAEIENKYEAQILSSISELKVQLSGLESISNFEDLLKSDKKAVEHIVTFLGISSEKFKRVCLFVHMVDSLKCK